MPMDHQALGIGRHILQLRLDMATWLDEPWSPDQVRWARGTLSHLALGRAGEEACTGEVWVQGHGVKDGVGYVASDFEVPARWDLRSADADWLGTGGEER
jgi:hypothetical protein